jgi:hypothetical protein
LRRAGAQYSRSLRARVRIYLSHPAAETRVHAYKRIDALSIQARQPRTDFWIHDDFIDAFAVETESGIDSVRIDVGNGVFEACGRASQSAAAAAPAKASEAESDSKN